MTTDPFSADPFAPVSPWNEPAQPAQETPSNNSRPEVPMSDSNKVRVTLKGGKGYDAPWVTIDGTDVEDALAQLNKSQAVKELLDQTAKVGGYFASLGDGPKPAPAASPATVPAGQPYLQDGRLVQPAQQQAPVQQAPQPAAPTCAHGPRNYKEGTGSRGPWAAYFCSGQGLDKSQQCPAMWRQKDGSFK